MEFKIELQRFIKNNLKRFFIITGVLFVILSAALFGLDWLKSANSPDSGESDIEYIHQFDLFIENSDDSMFSNPSIIRENIVLSGLHEQIEDELNIPLTVEDEETAETEFKYHLHRDSNSGRYTFIVNLDNMEDSELLANRFYDAFDNNEISVIDDKDITLFSEPYFVDEENGEESYLEQESYFNVKNLIVFAVFSAIIAVGYIILKDLFSKTINYYFSYDADKVNQFILIDKQLNNFNDIDVIKDSATNTLYLSDNSSESLAGIETKSLDQTDGQLIKTFDDVVIFVVPFETRKKWYRKQKEIIEWFDKPVKVIQVNAKR